MAQKMTGALVFDERTDRYDICLDCHNGGLAGSTDERRYENPLKRNTA